MSKSRQAIDTIVGYYYQFDYYILQLLSLPNENDIVCIEGIEDVDIYSLDKTTAVQCKYYSKTEYNHSVIAKPIRLMLNHFINSNSSKASFQYKIYGNFSSGQEKLSKEIDVSFLKEKYLTYTEKSIKHKYHSELGISDEELISFIGHLSIDINAMNFYEQEKCIINKLIEIFSCNHFEAEFYFYNNALRIVKQISTNHNEEDRHISKRDFISKIDNKQALFDIWLLKIKGLKSYCQSMKTQYFSQTNISPYERFFLIDCDKNISEVDLKLLIIRVARKWSKLSKREVTPFCPYIYLHNISTCSLLRIKKALQNDSIYFWDGYDYKDSDFSVKSICKKATAHNGVKLKIISELRQIDNVINSIQITREIYQFFISEPFFNNTTCKHIQIQVEKTININDII